MTQFTPAPRSRSTHRPAPARKHLSWPALIALVCLIFTASAAFAGETTRWSGLADTLFTHHTDPTTASGTAIAQDGTGFVWLATQSGLTRWDG